ncbi:DsrE/DsrF/DrsH-like family protein [Haloarcula laminariae]|uniref:DsrE/DsrF/DrsH-like family protein n=1 Tax=Haloarcula laminariae TaxID=2961577 RepID=UPI0021C6864D|nr:DsrE/DsrF/DrsH-like family protein [Halomicroarcula laminariae]
MSSESATADGVASDPSGEVAALEARIEDLEAEVDTLRDDGPKSMTIVATQGSLDMAYPPLILASTAAAFGWDVTVFHTFWGLDILHEDRSRDLQVSAVGNPNMPMPNLLGALPGGDALATWYLNREIADNGTATIEELVETSLAMGVDLQACEMTTELFDYDHEAFYDGVTTDVGAATALRHMADADVQLLV